jgi:lipopolysaccharide transport system ATP-binding protein
MSTAIEFHNVSKFFRMDRDRPRALQHLFVSLLRRKKRDEKRAVEVFWALRDVSFNVERGDSVGLIGTNGAGKSTTLKLISRIIQPSAGSVQVNGRVTALLELGAGFHPELSGRDNIYLNGAVMGLTTKEVNERLDQIVEFAELEDFIDVPVKDYSSGMHARLGFSVAVHLDPDILLIDEVLSVGDQAFQQKCNERMLELRQNGVTILFVSHSLEAVLRTCSKAIWLDHGKLKTEGDVQRVADAYYKNMLERSRRGMQPSGDNRYGSGEARVMRIELLDQSARPLNVALTNDPLIIRLHYHANQCIERPLFGLVFNHVLTGAHLAGPNNRFGRYEIPFIEGDGYMDYYIKRLPFLPGEYSISTTIYDSAGVHQYDSWMHCVRLKVAPGGTSERYGLIALEGVWTHVPEVQPPSSTSADKSMAEAVRPH